MSVTSASNGETKRIIWISDLIVDQHLHRTSRIEILRHLAKDGYDVCLFSTRSRKKVNTSSSGIPIISLPLRYVPILQVLFFAAVLSIVLPVLVLIKKPRYIITEPGPLILAFIWKPILSLLRVKVVLDIRSTPVELIGVRGSLTSLWFDVSVIIAKRLLDGLTIITRPMKEEVCRKFRIDPEVVGVWTSGVSAETFDPRRFNSHGVDLRERYGLKDRFVVMYHGNLGHQRGVIETVESIDIVRGKNDCLALVILGSGPALDEIRAILQTRTNHGDVVLHPPVAYQDLPKYIAMCDVGIVPLPDLPDWRNQCPLKLLEYLAMEKVVIVTDIPAHREVVGDSRCGIYASSAEPDQVAEAILYAIKNRQNLKEWGLEGRRIINQRYTWNAVAKELEEYLRRLGN